MKSAEITDRNNLWTEKGLFIREGRYRFHCYVLINKKQKLCYMPSNCKLEKIVSLKDKIVYLKEYQGESDKFDYIVQAVKYRQSSVLINLQYLNRVIEKQLERSTFKFLGERKNIRREYSLGKYKSDFWIEETNSLIEVKSLLSWEEHASYPMQHANRLIAQLEKICELLDGNYNFYYFIFSLSPYVKTVQINKNVKYGETLMRCMEKGMHLKAFVIGERKKEFYVKKEIPVLLEE